MRKGRYVTEDEVSDIDRITGLSWAIDQKNTVSIQWSWPRNGGIKLAAVFAAQTGDETLTELLEYAEPVVITKDMDKSYARTIDAERRVYRVFPAHFGEGADVIILNQQTGNTTDELARTTTVYYKLEYRALPLSEYRRVDISLKSAQGVETALKYGKSRGGVRLCEYPIGLGVFVCYIKKNETVELYSDDTSVFLIEEKS